MGRYSVKNVRKMAGEEMRCLTSTAESEEEIVSNETSPMVIQCSTCLMILGDSTSWVCANELLRTISLGRVTETVVLGKSLITSTDEIDTGSTFTQLNCDRCKSVVGKQYKTTPRHLDSMRDVYTFDVDRIESYQLGTAEVSAPTQQPALNEQDFKRDTQMELLRAQSLLVGLHHRVATLEAALNVSVEQCDGYGKGD